MCACVRARACIRACVRACVALYHAIGKITWIHYDLRVAVFFFVFPHLPLRPPLGSRRGKKAIPPIYLFSSSPTKKPQLYQYQTEKKPQKVVIKYKLLKKVRNIFNIDWLAMVVVRINIIDTYLINRSTCKRILP